MKRRIMTGAVIIVAGLAAFLIKTFYSAGEFKEIKPHSNYTCIPVEGIPGPEDIDTDSREGFAYISSDNRRGNAEGGIFRYNLRSENRVPEKISGNLPFDFHPHGISFYREKGKMPLLFVINHRREPGKKQRTHFIEIFKITGKELKYLRSISGSLLISPNDIAAVGGEKFYVTNDHGSTSPVVRFFEEYLQLSFSNIVYYDGKKFRRVAGDLKYGNGIALDREGNFLYAASTLSGEIKIYRRNREKGDLKFIREMDLDTGVDNITVDHEGNLWIGCHPKLLTFVKHAKDPGILSPSQVIRVKFGSGAAYIPEEVYLDSGKELSASSVAVPYRDRLLIGAVFDSHILDCKKKKIP